jgi:two-component system, NarL family, nitrate/nitrite response regulator NarL
MEFAASGNAGGRAGCHHEGVALRCLIVDDSTAFLAAARVLLEREGIDVVGVASTGREAVQQAAALRPDVILVDIDLGAESGLALTRRLAHMGGGGSPLILISTHAHEDFADLIAMSPALGFLPKAALSARAILDVLDGSRR